MSEVRFGSEVSENDSVEGGPVEGEEAATGGTGDGGTRIFSKSRSFPLMLMYEGDVVVVWAGEADGRVREEEPVNIACSTSAIGGEMEEIEGLFVLSREPDAPG